MFMTGSVADIHLCIVYGITYSTSRIGIADLLKVNTVQNHYPCIFYYKYSLGYLCYHGNGNVNIKSHVEVVKETVLFQSLTWSFA